MSNDKSPEVREPALRTFAMPANANANGDIFGGWRARISRWDARLRRDRAAAIRQEACRRRCQSSVRRADDAAAPPVATQEGRRERADWLRQTAGAMAYIARRRLPGPRTRSPRRSPRSCGKLGLLAQMDLAGAVAAIRRAHGRVATVAVDAMTFHKPVNVGDLVSCYAEVVRVGRSSMTVKVETWVERRGGGGTEKVTEGTFTFVAIDGQGKPRPVDDKMDKG
jgi:acyl-CoA thioesterase YciA